MPEHNNTSGNKSQESSDPIDRYVMDHSLRYLSRMLGSLDEAQFFQVIIQLMGFKRCIEVGTFTGYTALTIALALPSDGQLIACDISDEYILQDLWKKTGVDKKITLKVGPGVESDTSESTVAIRQINYFVLDDQCIDISFLRLGDGTTLCRNK
ncbi:hypothetical protein I4U23_004363 [Adineta vaga]|nr:hypothetical protein I4U23_004363 [Adineta vaga]